MTVKDDLLEWIITNKNEINDDAESYVTFRAGEAAGDLGTNINNVSKALGALRDEGLVVNPAHGFWAWTGGVPVEKPVKATRSPRKAKSKDSTANAIQTLWEAVLDIRTRVEKATNGMQELEAAVVLGNEALEAMREEEKALTAAYNLLRRNEDQQ